MISKFQTLIANTGVKDAQVQQTSDKINELDRIHLLDKGNQVTIEAGVVYRCIVKLASVRNLTPEAYISEFRKILEEKDEESNKSEQQPAV